MNAVTPTLVERPADVSPLGEISAAWQITPETLMVFGWQQEQAANEGAVAHQKPGAQKGRFGSLSWAAAAAGTHHFVAALQLPAGDVVRPDETLVLTGHGQASGILARLPARFLDAAAFGVELARLSVGNAAGSNALSITRFMLKMFVPAATRANADIRAMLFAFLERASTPDGCVELVGAVDDHCGILQGWGAPVAPDCEVVVVGAAIERCAPRFALFPRTDMRGNATGQVIVLPAAASRDAAQIAAVVLLDRRGMRWRPMIKERHFLSVPETVSHLRTVLPTFQCDAATRLALQASLRPRFDGRFTLYDGGQPVRLAVDLAAAAAGAGVYLTGWLFDPASAVAEVRLRGTRGASARLDRAWTRIMREDVTDAFRNDPALPRVEAGQHRHGFAVHAGSVEPAVEGEALYLDVSYRDGRCGFVPLSISAAGDATTRTRLLGSVDLHLASGMQIIEGHLAPFFARFVNDAGNTTPNVVAAIPNAWSTAIVVPLQDAMPPRALMSQFLRDPLEPGEGIVFVCGENWTDAAAESLRTQAVFYGIAPALLRIEQAVTAAAALAAVSAAAAAKHLLLLDPGTVGRMPGWRRAMHAALDASGGGVCVSPTVVYEDDSIRFGGTDGIEKLDVTPYIRIQRRLAGMPVSLIAAAQPAPSFTASLACCLLPREAVRALGPTLSLTATSSMQEADLFLRLRRNGVKSVWTPTAQVYAADRPSMDASENSGRVGRLVDGWCLRARLAAEV